MADESDTHSVPYNTAQAFRAAVTDRIAAVADDSPFTINQLRRQFAYDRLLSRLFATDASRWILMGAGGLLARIPGHARHSLDIDLFHRGELINALDQLNALGSDASFGDYFTFDIAARKTQMAGSANMELSVVAYLGEREFERFKIDLVVAANITAPPEVLMPIRPVDIPGLPAASYRVCALVDHIADKHAAMLGTHGGVESTRYRDLVDLAVIAKTQRVEAAPLRTAMLSEYAHRGLPVPTEVTLPSDRWIDGYVRAAKSAPNLSQPTAREALALVAKMLEPILRGRTHGIWNPTTATWDS